MVVLGEEQMEMVLLDILLLVKSVVCDGCDLCVLVAAVWVCIYTNLSTHVLVTPG